MLPVADETRGASGSGRQKTMPFRARMLSGTTTESPPSIVGADELNFCVRDGERWERRLWRIQRPERVAAVDSRRWHIHAEENVGHRNRGAMGAPPVADTAT